MQDATNDNSLTPSLREKIEGIYERARDNVPSLTTGLLIAALLVGAGVGALVSKPFHRAEINREWRERIASKSAAVRDVLAKGDAEAEAADNAILETLGAYDARLSSAEAAFASAAHNVTPHRDTCRIPASSLH